MTETTGLQGGPQGNIKYCKWIKIKAMVYHVAKCASKFIEGNAK